MTTLRKCLVSGLAAALLAVLYFSPPSSGTPSGGTAPIAHLPPSQTAPTAVVSDAAAQLFSSESEATPTPNLLPAIATHINPPALPATVVNIATTSIKNIAKAAPPASSNTINVNQPITAQSFLSNTAVSFKTTIGGLYELILTTTINGKIISWDLLQTTVGGTEAIPQFSVSYSCNPQANLPQPGAPDQSPLFLVKNSYVCTISLTPATGNDRRIVSKDFSFTTPAGQLEVTPASSMNTVLTNDMNRGGIVFTNTDSAPTTITGITVDLSYTALTTLNGPLVLRFLDPTTEQILADYHMENLPGQSSSSYTYGQINISIPLTFTVKGLSQKLLPVEVLGVNKMLMSGIDPTVKVILRAVATDRNDVKTVLDSPVIAWSCVVVLTGYDPNATSGPAAVGNICHG